MIRSMTGFGRAGFECQGRSFEVEVRSVNHRHLDVRVKLPRALGDGDAGLKSRVAGLLKRGKVDVSINLTGQSGGAGVLEVDEALAAEYVAAGHKLSRIHGLEEPLGVADLLNLPGVSRFVEATLEVEALIEAAGAAMDAALATLVSMREREGEALARELRGRLATVLSLVDAFEARSGEVVERAKERLRKRTEQIKQETGMVDEARLHQEIVIAADRLDITEELVRLRSHVDQFESILARGDEPVGRQLDFLLQEMGREANTVGSKASDAPLAHQVVDLKTELERLREQVQNVE